MSDSPALFNPEKISFVEFKMVKGQVDVPETFDSSQVIGHNLDNTLQLSFHLEEKLVKADFTAAITSKSHGANIGEASGRFHLVFIYRIENLEALAQVGSDNLISLHPALANALSSITYSTSRGILLTRLQGTALQNFVLPVINPNDLLSKAG